MTRRIPLYRVSLAAASLLMLSACVNMPTGYRYHKQIHKHPAPQPVADAVLITPDQAQQIYRAVRDMTGRLTDRAGLAPKPIYVNTPKPATQLQNLMDNDLRDSLRSLGYTLTLTPNAGYQIRHFAVPVNTHDGMTVELRFDIYNATQASKETPPVFLTSQSGLYHVDNFEHIMK